MPRKRTTTFDIRRAIALIADRGSFFEIGPLWGTDQIVGFVRFNGYAMGGGCEIALACHLIVADATAQFALSEVRVGLVAGAGGLIRLPRTVPPKVATEMILTGRRITAAEALSYGLVNRVVSAGAALDGARVLAAEILAGSPTSVRVSLQIMEETGGIPDVAQAVSYHPSALDDLMSTQDAAEGPAAFAAKRQPQWRNR